MALKYKFNLKDINLEDFRVYLLALFNAFLPKKKINNIDELEVFIQSHFKILLFFRFHILMCIQIIKN